MKLFTHKGLFITATDTGAGKTLISGVVAKLISQQGKKVGVFKPIATGCRTVKGKLISEDAEFLKYCCNSELALDVITPIRYKIPAAPLACEKAEKKKVNLSTLFNAYEQICRNSDFVVVEGIGGVKVPITSDFDVLDLAKALKLPVIIVAKAKLGTINHTLLTIEAVRRKGLLLAGIIINGYDEKTVDFAEKTNAEFIKKLGKTKILAVVPDDKKTNMAKNIVGRKVTDALRKINWLKIK
ncbi:MAG: dethiobiotin synthase [Planctomycetes bacterium GWF2_42_9]|nr:MAG: dethiobiotin synthase [Planctomycetes bacterium GWF2_42_9]HAL45453.1 dethiobiotin synthase [Phycisphaerales bacterium]